jgi:hypothetical protein
MDDCKMVRCHSMQSWEETGTLLLSSRTPMSEFKSNFEKLTELEKHVRKLRKFQMERNS